VSTPVLLRSDRGQKKSKDRRTGKQKFSSFNQAWHHQGRHYPTSPGRHFESVHQRGLKYQCRLTLLEQLGNEAIANAEFSLVERCVQNFCETIRPSFSRDQVVYVATDTPAEFIFDNLTIIAAPELAVRTETGIDIYQFKTGKPSFARPRELELLACGLTCWARVALREVSKPIAISEVFLRGSPIVVNKVSLSDGKISEFVEDAKAKVATYTVSARLSDFPATPSVATCRFCDFTVICPEHMEFSEPDYGLEALERLSNQQSAAVAKALLTTGGETRHVFLSHCSEDKEDFVRPLARALKASGFTYWLDEAEILWGESVVRAVNKGLATSDFVMVFMTEEFMRRGWPQAEVEAALEEQIRTGKLRVLPLIIDERDTVLAQYPLLRTAKSVSWNDGVDAIVEALRQVVRATSQQ
jgi:hypothetical protein